MESRVDPRFRKLLSQMPKKVRGQTLSAYKLWKTNSNHPTLHFKLVIDRLALWSVRCGISDGTHYRALGAKKSDDVIIWFWVGTHAEYDHMLDKLQGTSKGNAPRV